MDKTRECNTMENSLNDDLLDTLTVQANHIKNALEGIINGLYDINCKDQIEKLNILIATSEAVKVLTEKHADHLESLEV